MQTQQMWSYSHNITLFAAGANNPWLGSGGSGAYRGIEGTAVGGIVAEGGIKVFIYQGNKSKDTEDIDVLAKKMDGFRLKIDHSIQGTSYRVNNPFVTIYNQYFQIMNGRH